MQIKQLDHINLSVENLAESVSWYQRVFGFVVVEEGVQEEKPWCIIKGGEAMLCMYEAPGREFSDRFQFADRELHTISHFAFRIEDRAGWEKTIAEQSVEVRYDGAIEWPNSTSWYVSDPTGYEIEVALWKRDSIAFS